jgi:hypothetical protein
VFLQETDVWSLRGGFLQVVFWGDSLVEPKPGSIFQLDGLNQLPAEHVTSTGSSANITNTEVNHLCPPDPYSHPISLSILFPLIDTDVQPIRSSITTLVKLSYVITSISCYFSVSWSTYFHCISFSDANKLCFFSGVKDHSLQNNCKNSCSL